MGVLPQNCAYVGDNLSRDLIGAMQAGFGSVIIINMTGYQTDEYDPDDDFQAETITETKPQYRIGRLGELLEIFHGVRETNLSKDEPQQPDELYDISLSTMWSADQEMPFSETFGITRKLGFVSFEFSNKITPRLYQEWDRNKYYVATIHDPCPSEFGYTELKRQDVALSSLDETQRVKSVDNLKRSIDLAVLLGSRSVVVHCGAVHCDHKKDKKLRELYLKGMSGTVEYSQIQQEYIADRNQHKEPHISQVIRSLEEVISFARGSGVAIALENRNRYHDLPLPDEMETFLQLCDEPWLGFQYDVGHAHNLEVLGMVGKGEWLRRFHHRLIGMHLHDVNGLQDHLAPGMGEVDFSSFSPYLVDGVLRTLEVSPDCTIDQIAHGLDVLVDHGCVKKV
jgi:sugar phosphate isomerase/epimerase